MNDDSVIAALVEQVACYRKLAKLAEVQHEHVQNSQIEGLLDVLRARQTVLDLVARHEAVISPAKRRWSEYLGEIDPSAKARAEALLAETLSLLEQITTADRNDSIVLQQRKVNLGRQINKAAAARQVNRNYAASAYGKAAPRFDVSR